MTFAMRTGFLFAVLAGAPLIGGTLGACSSDSASQAGNAVDAGGARDTGIDSGDSGPGDAAPPDAVAEASAEDGGSCADGTCDGYCLHVSGGPPVLARSGAGGTCKPLPSSCNGVASCACLEADAGLDTACSCSEDAGAVTVTCVYP